MSERPRIVVVGAGIVGAAIAWHLAPEAEVVVVDAGEAGGVATPLSFAWINASWGNPEPYFRLRIRAMAGWRSLAAEVPGLPLSWTGGLCWELPPAELDAYAREHGAWGYGIRRLDRSGALEVEPGLAEPPDLALHVAGEGAVEPRLAAEMLIADARRRGARFRPHTRVTALSMRSGRAVGIETTAGHRPADAVVVAAGTGAAALAATAGIDLPMTTPPGLLAHSRPHPRLLNGIVQAPGLHIRQTAEGRIVAGPDFGGGDPGPDPQAAARALIDRSKAMLTGAGALELDFHTVGYRPTPADGFPVIGRANGDRGPYLAVMHSGVTLAPAVGALAAEELLTGRRDPLLAPYGPWRFR